MNRSDIISLLLKSLKNPRSALCKTAIMTSADMFKAYNDDIIDSLDLLVICSIVNSFVAFSLCISYGLSIFRNSRYFLFSTMLLFLVLQLVQLLLKSSQDKRFVCEAAERALNTLTSSVSPLLLLPKLQPYIKHRNPRIRAKASMFISRSVPRLVNSLNILN